MKKKKEEKKPLVSKRIKVMLFILAFILVIGLIVGLSSLDLGMDEKETSKPTPGSSFSDLFNQDEIDEEGEGNLFSVRQMVLWFIAGLFFYKVFLSRRRFMRW